MGSPGDIVKITIYVTSINDWRASALEQQSLFNEYFKGEYLANDLGDAPWPKGIGGRVYRNRFVREWDGREEAILNNREELLSDAAQAWERHDPEVASVYMGQSAGGINSIRPAARVLQDICDQAESILRTRSRDLLR